MVRETSQSFAVAVASELVVLIVIVLAGAAILNLSAIVGAVLGDFQ